MSYDLKSIGTDAVIKELLTKVEWRMNRLDEIANALGAKYQCAMINVGGDWLITESEHTINLENKNGRWGLWYHEAGPQSRGVFVPLKNAPLGARVRFLEYSHKFFEAYLRELNAWKERISNAIEHANDAEKAALEWLFEPSDKDGDSFAESALSDAPVGLEGKTTERVQSGQVNCLALKDSISADRFNEDGR